MKTDKPTDEPDDNPWPPPPSTERPAAEPVAETEKFPIAQVVTGFLVGVLSPVGLMIVVMLALAETFPFSRAFSTLWPAVVAAVILPVQFAVFWRHRKARPAFAEIYLVVSMLVGLVLIFGLFGLRDSD